MSVLFALVLAAAPANGCAGPRPGWLTPAILPPNLPFNRITLTGRDEILWNGMPVTWQILHQYLGVVATMTPLPLTILVPEHDADCALLEAVRDEIDSSLPCAPKSAARGPARGPSRTSCPLHHHPRRRAAAGLRTAKLLKSLAHYDYVAAHKKVLEIRIRRPYLLHRSIGARTWLIRPPRPK